MWSRVWLLGLVGACYAPTLTTGAPCDPSIDNCPAGQVCGLRAGEYRCGGPGEADSDAAIEIDASIIDAIDALDGPMIDGSMIDAPMIDAPGIDAPPGAVTLACMHACDAIGVCAMGTDAGCVGECSADLADCTAQQVQDVDACTTMACGD